MFDKMASSQKKYTMRSKEIQSPSIGEIKKYIRYSINKTNYSEYIFFLKKILKNDSILKYIENTDLWNVSIDTDLYYLENDAFLETIFGCLWKKTSNTSKICMDLYDILMMIFINMILTKCCSIF